MTKLIVLAAFGVAGLVSAKDNVEKVNSIKKEVTTTKEIKKIKRVRQVECGVFQASCTSAYTCQDWTSDQWIRWMEKIQQNYCQV